ncbi:N-6 DNA methylase [Streptomyces sp. NRRL F-5053]|uniref:N-6 DNA methylase n=1 Tax=Streptomyces sp. NRRL F-5053 TaxID=1463854 RepID=UPI0004C6E65D|nr:N-6 DNA methylase [Streptomyces sp. NRRL F-5053]
MSQPSAQVTAAEISRIAGVTRATVSNWRRRHEDFPAPTGGTESSPLYDLTAVQEWLHKRGATPSAPPQQELRTALRMHGAGIGPRLFPLVFATSTQPAEELAKLAQLPDRDLVEQANSATTRLPPVVPDAGATHYVQEEAPAVRALLRTVQAHGPQEALDLLASRELEDVAKTGTSPTPAALASLMAGLLPDDVHNVLDPACGSGTLLVEAARHGAEGLYGQDLVPVQAQRTAIRLLISAPDAATTVHVGDSLRADAFPDLTVDAVLSSPPFGLRDWGQDELSLDPRWMYGVPSRVDSELAWVQHALAHLEPGGYAVLLMPPALAFRSSARRIRTELVRSRALRAVIALPPRVLAYAGIAPHLWVLQRPDPTDDERPSVLFVETTAAARDTRSHSREVGTDWAAIERNVLPTWVAFRDAPETFTDAPGLARAVPVVDLLSEQTDLAPARHVRQTPADIDPARFAERAFGLRRQLAQIARPLTATERRWRSAGESAREWRWATIADLTRGGAVTLFQTAARSPKGDSGGNESGAGQPVLLVRDLLNGASPSGTAQDIRPGDEQPIQPGDVLLPRASASGDGPLIRVADDADAEALLGPHIYLLRPNAQRLDSWFLAGFLGSRDNLASASTSTGSFTHLTPNRMRVPLLPLPEQSRYGDAFRRVHELRAAAHHTAALAQETADTLTDGLTLGALIPPDGDVPQ